MTVDIDTTSKIASTMCLGNFITITVVSKLITDRHFLWGIQIQNRAARRINFITGPDQRECQKATSHYRYRFSLEFQLVFITDADLQVETNSFCICNHVGHNGMSRQKVRLKWFLNICNVIILLQVYCHKSQFLEPQFGERATEIFTCYEACM